MTDCSMLETLPESFGNLSCLQSLKMSSCFMLKALPESFGNLSSLQTLLMDNLSMLERLPDSFGNLSSLQKLDIYDILSCSKLERLPQTFHHLSCLQSLVMIGCKKMCSLSDNFGQLKSLKFLCISNCKELKKLPEDVVCSTSLAAIRAYGCAELEEKALDSLVEIRSLMFLEMDDSPLLIKRWEEIQQHRPLIGAALRFELHNYPYEEIMSAMLFNGGSRFLNLDGDGQLAEAASSLFPEVGVKLGLLLTACDLSETLKERLVEVASQEFQIIYVDVDMEESTSSWMEEREKRIRETLLHLPEGSRVWTSRFYKTSLLFAYSLWRFAGSAVDMYKPSKPAVDTLIVGTSVVVDEKGRRKLSHPLEMILRRNCCNSHRVDFWSIFSPLSEALEWMVGR